jgi:DNA repair exonuclease SbcCD ATPase subunit
MADSAGADAMFKDKDADVDWDAVLKLKEDGAVSKLQQAAKNSDAELEDLVREADKLFSAVCGFRVNKDDARTDVENLAYLFEFTQALSEMKAHDLKKANQKAEEYKGRYKNQRQDIKDYEARIAEQDTEIERLLSQLTESVKSPTKGGGGEGVRNEQEFKNLQKTLESTKERLSTVERERDDERAKAKELQEKERKAQSEKEELQRALDAAEADREEMERQAAEDKKRDMTNKKNAQKAARDTYKFVKELADLNEQVCMCLPHTISCIL